MADDQFIVEVEIDFKNATQSATRLTEVLARFNREVDSPALRNAEKNLAKFATGNDKIARSQKETANQTQLYNQYLYDQARALGNVTTQLEQYRRAQANVSRESARASTAAVGNNLAYIPQNQPDNYRVGSAFGNIVDEDDKRTQQASRSYHNLSVAMDDVIDARQRESSSFAQSLRAKMEDDVATEKSAASHERLGQSLSTTRYAMFSVAATLGIVSAGMIASGVAIAGTAVTWERSFANVIRTSDALRTSFKGNGDLVEEMRRQFVDLAQTMPVAFESLAEIGTLGNQLGVQADNLAAFVRVAAQFSTVTGMSVEETATAFGRLDSLLPGVQHNYTALGSAILKVGVNSVATEAQITKTAVQLSAMSTQAGLTADQVVGLAGAFASIGVMPELSRGTVTRLFSQMGKAVTENGESLKEFARVSGVSAEEFSQAYGSPEFGRVFLSFMQGIRNEGASANATLQELGINSVRDRPALLNLANAADSAGKAGGLLAQTFGDANSGMREQSEIADQYAVIAETVASRLTVLGNNFSALFDAIGSNALGPIGDLIDGLSSAVGWLTDFASTDIGGAVLGWTVALVTIAGVLTAVAAAGALAYSGIVGLQQALVGLVPATAAVAAPGIGGLAAQMTMLGGSSRIAALGINVLGVAMKALSFGAILTGAVLAASAITKFIGDASYAAQGLDTGFSASLKRVQGNAEQTANYFGAGTFAAQLNRGFAAFSGDTMLRDIAKVDEGLRDLAQNGGALEAAQNLQQLSNQMIDQGVPLETVKAQYTDAYRTLQQLGFQVKENSAGFVSLVPPTEAAAAATQNFALQAELAALNAEQAGASIGVTGEEFTALGEAISQGATGFFNWSDMIQRSQDKTKGWAEEQSEKVYDTKESWQEFYDGSSVNLQDFMTVLDQQIAAQQTWATDMQTLTDKGATAFVTEIAAMGPEAAPLAAAAVNATEDELRKLEAGARLAGFLASDAFKQSWVDQTPLLAAAYSQGGITAVQALIDAQVSGAPGAVDEVIAAFDLHFAANPADLRSKVNQGDLTAAEAALDDAAKARTAEMNAVTTNLSYAESQLNRLARTRYVDIVTRNSSTSGSNGSGDSGGGGGGGGGGGLATGGYVRGPGTGTSDSISTRLSNGEYVIKAASVRKWGVGYLNALNSGTAKLHGKSGGYANGGIVRSGGGSSVVELSPADRDLLRAAGNLQVVIPGQYIGQATNAYNKREVGRGSA